jgi:hypothetical protein
MQLPLPLPPPGFFLSFGGGAPPVARVEGSFDDAFTAAEPESFETLLTWELALLDEPAPAPDGVTWRTIAFGKLRLSLALAASACCWVE